MPPNAVGDLDRVRRHLSTMQQHEQFSKVVAIGTRVVRLSGHQRQPSPSEVTGPRHKPPNRTSRTGGPTRDEQPAQRWSSAYSEDVVGDRLMLVAKSERVSAAESAESRCGFSAVAERSRTADRGGMGG